MWLRRSIVTNQWEKADLVRRRLPRTWLLATVRPPIVCRPLLGKRFSDYIQRLNCALRARFRGPMPEGILVAGLVEDLDPQTPSVSIQGLKKLIEALSYGKSIVGSR
jgi:hypothetical protein